MGSILELHNEWRDSLRLASFRGVYFHVETSGRQSGRRTVTHQFPKRNLPYAEDMGREAVHWSFTAYILLHDMKLNHGNNAIYAGLVAQRNALVQALEEDGPGELVHPSLSFNYTGGREGSSSGGPMTVMCERYSVSESRQKGGYYEFDMQFVEAGLPPTAVTVDTRSILENASQKMSQEMKNQLKKQLGLGNKLASIKSNSVLSAVKVR